MDVQSTIPPDNVEPDFFEVEITRFDPVRDTKERRIKSVKGLDRLLASFRSETQFVVGVTAFDEDECDMGSFWLFLNGDRAWIHLIEGACYTAVDPGFSPKLGDTLAFQDDAGMKRDIPLLKTISRDQGIAALRHWLPHGEKLPALNWDRD